MMSGRNSGRCLLRKLSLGGSAPLQTPPNGSRRLFSTPLSPNAFPTDRSRWWCSARAGNPLPKQRRRRPELPPSFETPGASGIPSTPTRLQLRGCARRPETTVSAPPVSGPVRSARRDSDRDSLPDLRRKTGDWLSIPTGSRTSRDASAGRFLIREWSEVGETRERAVQQTRILRRWMREKLVATAAEATAETATATAATSNDPGFNRANNGDYSDNRELVEMLNRCLDSWRKASPTISSANQTRARANRRNTAAGSGTISPHVECTKLMNLFWDASESLRQPDLRPGPKTCSMHMNVLALYPESPTACDDVLSVLERCKKNKESSSSSSSSSATTADPQFYNVCLHTLAKCARHHPEAPELVESIVREMTTVAGLSPNTACFVSLLHAWANAIPASAAATDAPRGDSHSGTTSPLPAERIEAILDQMIESYPHLVDTICFNISIDAWGKQGYPHEAEKVLWRLHRYHREASERLLREERGSSQRHQREVRPNEVSFNSAINAWAKSGATGSRHRHRGGGQTWDPVEAADRAEYWMGQMRRHGHEPTPETVGAVLEAYARLPDPGPKAQGLLDELEAMYSEGELSFPPSKVCYLMAVRAWGRTRSGGAERADSLVQRMNELSSSSSDRSDLEPCVVVYTALLSAWAESDATDAPERALGVYREMERLASSGENAAAAPNTLSLNALLEAFCNRDRIDRARELLSRARRRVRPNARSYRIVLRGYAGSKDPRAPEHAEEFLEELETDYRNGGTVKPTAAMYSQLLAAWGNSPRHDGAFRAEEIFWRMLRRDDDRDYSDSDSGNTSVRPDTTTLNCVLRAWSRSFEGGNAERAEAVLRTVRNEHSDELEADPVSHRHLIYAWAHSRRKKAPERAEAHLEEAKRLCASGANPDWKLTRAHFRGVALAWEKSGDRNAPRRIQRLREEMAGMFNK